MAEIKDGGPAFPHSLETQMGQAMQTEGMALRDYFAAAALTSVIQIADRNAHWVPADMARDAYSIADAMLTEREKRP